jgi:ribonuclease HI
MSDITINTDGGARGNPGPAGVGVVFSSQTGKILHEFKAYIGEATNNVAEYKALVLALEEAEKLNYKELQILMDSELVVRQMQGVYKIKEPALQVLAKQVLALSNHFKKVAYRHIPREKNKAADKLVNQAIDAQLGS